MGCLYVPDTKLVTLCAVPLRYSQFSKIGSLIPTLRQELQRREVSDLFKVTKQKHRGARIQTQLWFPCM